MLKKITDKIFEVTSKAVEDGARPEDIFGALENMFVYWLAHVSDEERAETMRELEEHLPNMLKRANKFAAEVVEATLQ
jgi:hypothetical protein